MVIMLIPMIFTLITFGLYIFQAVWVAIDSRKRGEEIFNYVCGYMSNGTTFTI